MIRQGTGTIIALLLTACATPQPGGAPPVDEAGSCGDVVEFYAAASQLPAAAGQEMRQALRPNGSADDPCDRLRLALLLSRPGTDFYDDTEAARLLADFLADPATALHPQRGLASLLADSVAERRWLVAEQARLEESLARERASAQGLTEKLQQARAAETALRRRVKALRSQLDQLKSIERDINEKARSVENPPADREGHEPKQDTPG